MFQEWVLFTLCPLSFYPPLKKGWNHVTLSGSPPHNEWVPGSLLGGAGDTLRCWVSPREKQQAEESS